MANEIGVSNPVAAVRLMEYAQALNKINIIPLTKRSFILPDLKSFGIWFRVGLLGVPIFLMPVAFISIHHLLGNYDSSHLRCDHYYLGYLRNAGGMKYVRYDESYED